MPRWAAKADDNQPAMVAALRAVGFTVQHLHTIGKGCPDLLVGAFGVNLLVEVKMPGEDLTDDEKVFHGCWSGAAIVSTAPQSVIEWLYRNNAYFGEAWFAREMHNNIDHATAIYNAEMLKITHPTPKRAYTRKARKTL